MNLDLEQYIDGKILNKNTNKITYMELYHWLYMRCKQNTMQTDAMHTRDKFAHIEYLRQVFVFLSELPGSYAFPEEMEQIKTLNR